MIQDIRSELWIYSIWFEFSLVSEAWYQQCHSFHFLYECPELFAWFKAGVPYVLIVWILCGFLYFLAYFVKFLPVGVLVCFPGPVDRNTAVSHVAHSWWILLSTVIGTSSLLSLMEHALVSAMPCLISFHTESGVLSQHYSAVNDGVTKIFISFLMRSTSSLWYWWIHLGLTLALHGHELWSMTGIISWSPTPSRSYHWVVDRWVIMWRI